MALPLYLAMTAEEMYTAEVLPTHTAWMACHFCPYSTGLSNLPDRLPPDSILILNDSTPPSSHDPERIILQLRQLAEETVAAGVLLDFQRPGNAQTAQIAKSISESLDCPVGVSQAYAKALDCPVFLDPVALHETLADHIAPWAGRQLWLDVATDTQTIGVFSDGSRLCPPPEALAAADSFEDEKLHCRYRIKHMEDHLLFTLWRTAEHMAPLLEEAQALGIQKAFGLYQQLGKK